MKLPPTLVLALALAACAPEGRGGSGSASDGAALFQRHGCVSCHGQNRQGSSLAPALGALGEHWTVEQLVEYLRDPRAYAAADPRLRAQGEAYRTPMPPYDSIPVEQRTALAAWLLGPKAAPDGRD